MNEQLFTKKIMKNYTFWLKSGIFFQFLTGIFHSLSLVASPKPANETETKLFDLMDNYKFDLGAGYARSMNDLMTSFSICFTLLLFFAVSLNWFLLKKQADTAIMKGVIWINLVVFSICFVTMTSLTFLPPIICTGLISLSFLMAIVTIRNKN